MGCAPWRIRRLVEQLPTNTFPESTETAKAAVVVGWVIEQLMLVTITPDRVEGEYMVVDYYESGVHAIAAFADHSRLAI